MRVALNLEQLLTPPPGGIGRYTAELARLLPRLDRSGLGDGGGDGRVDGDGAVDIVPFVAHHGHERVAGALRDFGLDGADGVEPVVLPLPRPVLYDAWHVLGWPSLGVLSARLRDVDLAVPPCRDVPLVVTVHDAAPVLFPHTFPRRGRWFHARGIAAAARHADLVITVSNAAADELVAHTPIARACIRVVHNGVDQREVPDREVAATRAALGLGEDPYVLWVGTLEPRKNLPTLLAAFREVVAATDLRHRLLIVGPTGWRENNEVAQAARLLGDRVRFVGAVRGDQIAAVYRGADLFAFPSRHEGFGLPVLEAMAQRRAVVAADIPAIREIAGDAATLIAPDDVDLWAGALTWLLRAPAVRSELGERGRDRAAQFSWDRCAAGTRAVYAEAIGGAILSR
jgi:glycosyltransferase involved in cell wall biosynthesis